MSELQAAAPAGAAVRWAKVIDHTRCIGCHACTTACKSENEVPLGVTRTYVKYVDVGVFPEARRSFQVTRCNQCDDAPCVDRLPDLGDVPARRRHRRLRQVGLHRLQGVHRRLPLRRDLHQPRGPLGREVQLLRAPHRPRPRAGLRGGLPDRGDPGRRPRTTRLEGVEDRPPRARSPCGGRRRTPSPSCSTRALTRRPSIRWPPAAPTGGLFMWSEQDGAATTRSSRATPGGLGRLQLLGRGAPRLRRAARQPLGLAGQPLHLDQGHRRRRLPGAAALAVLAGIVPEASPLWTWGAPVVGGHLPRPDRAAPDFGPGAPGPLLDDLHAAAVAELAGARRFHHRRLRGAARGALRGRPRRADGRAALRWPGSACRSPP